jgi:hypothetical protein
MSLLKNPNTLKKEVSSGRSISGTVKYKGPKKDVRIDLMKEKKGQLVQSIQKLKTE